MGLNTTKARAIAALSKARRAEALQDLAYVPTNRTIYTVEPITGSGDLSTDRVIGILKASKAEAETGVNDIAMMTALTTKAAMIKYAADTGTVQLGANGSKLHVNSTDGDLYFTNIKTGKTTRLTNG